MPRNRKRKTSIGLHSEDQMRSAVAMILGGMKIRAVAKTTQLPFTTLYRYYKKTLNAGSITNVKFTPNYAVHRIFDDFQEQALVDYIIKCSQMFYGLTINDTRKLAYDMAKQNDIHVPKKWHDTQLAGLEWYYGFRKRHPRLSLRTPEGCSLSRATSFNRHNVNLFFDNLHDTMTRHPVFGDGTRVYNLDETNTVTVQKSAKVLAPKNQKQVSKVTSAEKGTLVTTCYIINAIGNVLPPVLIFPRVNFKQHMIAEAPSGTLGLANPTGWMNSDLFVKTMEHFIRHTNSSKENPSLLIMDNYEAHICLEAVILAKESGVTILTVPPHSTGKLQPLDVAVFGPFKTAYNAAVDSWMMRNPGKTFSIYEVAGCVKDAHMKSMTPSNICSAFRATGIFPFNRDVFTDLDFAPSEVTDRLEVQENLPTDEGEDDVVQASSSPSLLQESNILREASTTPSLLSLQVEQSSGDGRTIQDVAEPSNNNLLSEQQQALMQEVQIEPPVTPEKTSTMNSRSLSNNVRNVLPSTSGGKEITTFSQKKQLQKPSISFSSPFQFRGLPKADKRKGNRAPRRKGKSMIATDTPNKDEIEQRFLEKTAKKRKTAAKLKKKKVLQSSSSSENDDKMSIYSEEEGMFVEEEDNVVDPDKFYPLHSLPKEGDFILVEFIAKSKKVYYVGKVIGVKNNEVEVTFLRKSVKNPNKFHLPCIPDISVVSSSDIKMILVTPTFSSGTTKRMQGLYQFNVDFSMIDLR